MEAFQLNNKVYGKILLSLMLFLGVTLFISVNVVSAASSSDTTPPTVTAIGATKDIIIVA